MPTIPLKEILVLEVTFFIKHKDFFLSALSNSHYYLPKSSLKDDLINLKYFSILETVSVQTLVFFICTS